MEKRRIQFIARGQVLEPRYIPCVPVGFASGTIGYLEAEFDMDEAWDGFDTIKAIFVSNSAREEVELTDGVCDIPASVLTTRGWVFVNLVGETEESDVVTERLTTNQVPAIPIRYKAEVPE